MATKAEIRNKAGVLLGIKQLSVPMQSQNSDTLDESYDEVYAQLRKDGLAIWASTGSVPDELTPHVAALVADNSTFVNGLSPARFERVRLAALVGKREIRKYATQDFISQDDPTDF